MNSQRESNSKASSLATSRVAVVRLTIGMGNGRRWQWLAVAVAGWGNDWLWQWLAEAMAG